MNTQTQLFNLPVKVSFRPEIGITRSMQDDRIIVEYPTLGFSESLNPNLVAITFLPTITKEQYESAWECMPPIRITGCNVFAFAPDEPYSFNQYGVTYVCYSLINDCYFKIIATLADAAIIFNALAK